MVVLKMYKLSWIVFVFLTSQLIAQDIYHDWTIGVEGLNDQNANDMIVLPDGSIIIASSNSGSADYDPSENTSQLNATGFMDGVITKYSKHGKLLWVKQIKNISPGFVSYSFGTGLCNDDDFNIYLSGSYLCGVDLDPGNNSFSVYPQAEQESYILKLDSAGNFIWAKSIGGIGMTRVIISDINWSNSNEILICGRFTGTVDFNPGTPVLNFSSLGYSPFVSRYDINGDMIWTKIFEESGAGLDNGANIIKVDNSGNINIGGSIESTIDFDAGIGTYYLTNLEYYPDFWICKLDQNGNFLWVNQYGDFEYHRLTDFCLDSQGNLYACGGFRGDAVYGEIPYEYSISAFDFMDIVYFKLDMYGNIVWLKTFDGYDSELISSIVQYQDSLLFLSGFISNQTEFSNGIVSDIITPYNGSGILQKIDTSGNLIWTIKQPDSFLYEQNSILYFLGNYSEDTLDFYQHNDSPFQLKKLDGTDVFVSKYKLDTSISEDIPVPTDSVVIFEEVKIYPIPFSDFLWLELPNSFDQCTILFYNDCGQLIIELNDIDVGLLKLDLKNISSGIYTIWIFSNLNSFKSRVIKI